MPFVFNPLTGQLDFVNASSGGGGGTYTPGTPAEWDPSPTTVSGGLDQLANRTYGKNYIPEKFTLSAGNITSKSVTLASTPITAAKTTMSVVGGSEQIYGTDFTVSGTTLSWASLALDGVLEAGDTIIVRYSA